MKPRPSAILNRSSHFVIVHRHLFRPVCLFILLCNVGDGINVQHNTERLRFPLLSIITRIGSWIFVHGFNRRRFIIIRWPSVSIVVVSVKTCR